MTPTEELTLAHKRLSTLEEEFQDFAYIVSHDLSGPLRHAIGFSEMLLANNEDILDEKSIRHLNHIRKSALQGRHVLELLRDYSRLNTRPFYLKEDIALKAVVESVKAGLAQRIKATGATIHASSLPKISGDIEKIEAVFYALLKNAVSYHHAEREPEILIDSRDEKSHWHFRVSDNGMGIPERQQSSVLRVLRRAVDALDYPGEGMGLAYAKKIVEKHQGELWIGNSSDEGTVIEFTLSKSPIFEDLPEA
jgi:light-regulated signal transduction histidine kinase (bacteriophytochrome)